jgi:hypothetical protein
MSLVIYTVVLVHKSIFERTLGLGRVIRAMQWRAKIVGSTPSSGRVDLPFWFGVDRILAER